MRLLKNVVTFLLAVSPLAPFAAKADGDVTKKFREAALEAIEEAQRAGFNNFGDINFTDLKEFTQNVPIQYYPNINMRVGNRRCAMWMDHSNTSTPRAVITLNKDCAVLSKEELKSIALHEVLGGGFKADRNYEITLQVFNKRSASSWLIDTQNIKSTIKKFEMMKFGDNGSSTGVGGGGDNDDLAFKKAGITYLETLDTEKLWNIPKDLLRYSLYHMNSKPAADIKNTFLMRGTNVESDFNRSAVVYVKSEFYRNKELSELHGYLAVQAARLYLVYAADEMGLVNEKVGWTKRYTTDSVNKPCLAMRSGSDSITVWRNPKLLARYSESEAAEVCRFEVRKLQQSALYDKDKLWNDVEIVHQEDLLLEQLKERQRQLEMQMSN